jgi:hypothetical protein
MGTRAGFFINDARDVEKRICLGYIHYDGYPDGVSEIFSAKNEEDFRNIIKNEFSNRSDFSSPEKGFPYPWPDDLYLTDYIYSFIPNSDEYYYGSYVKFEAFGGYHVTNEEYDSINILYEKMDDTSKLPELMNLVFGPPENFNNIPAPSKEWNGDMGGTLLISL